MGKALAAWIMMAEPSRPRDGSTETVETAVIRVMNLAQDIEPAAKSESAAPGSRPTSGPRSGRLRATSSTSRK